MVLENIKQLIRLIEHEVALYDSFLQATMKQRQALIENDAAEISAIAGRQDRLLRQISATENSSGQVMAKCAQQMGIDAGAVSVAAIAGRLEAPAGDELTDAARRLLEIGCQVRTENTINRHLLNNLVRLTNYCLRGIAGLSQSPPPYRPGGAAVQQAVRCLALDSRV